MKGDVQGRVSRRGFLKRTMALSAAAAAGCVRTQERGHRRPPNFIIIFTDDQGYSDLGCFGSPDIRTPRLDRMAAEGAQFTDFYVSSPVCTPSRASLLTGCYAQRVSMSLFPRPGAPDRPSGLVIFPEMVCGLHPDEITLAEALKAGDYATACVGKWHLGHRPPFLPTRQGFDTYFGIPYSNDMKPAALMRDEEIIEPEVDQRTLTERYTEEAVAFLRANRHRPFFLYLAHNMPHVPLHVSERFAGKSARGLYGDVIETIDWSAGRILDTLGELELDEDTLVVFTSDNGPWLSRGEHGGTATPLRAGKGTTYEGGMRVPCIMRWRGRIPAGLVCSELATTMDLLPTFAMLARVPLPSDRVIDGKDIWPLMADKPGARSPHEAFFYYRGDDLEAVRSGTWKLVFERRRRQEFPYERVDNPEELVPESLYNLADDVGEQHNVIGEHREMAERLRERAEKIREELGDARVGIIGKNRRPMGIDPA